MRSSALRLIAMFAPHACAVRASRCIADFDARMFEAFDGASRAVREELEALAHASDAPSHRPLRAAGGSGS